MGTGSLVCVISLIDLHNPQKWRVGRRSEGQDRGGEVKCGEKKEKDKERDGKANHRRERKGLNFGMFCTICDPQIEREIAVCCWRVSVINLVSK